MMDTMPGLELNQEALLERIVAATRDADSDSEDRFVAVRVGLAGVLIYHPGSRPIAVDDMGDLQTLAERGYLALTRAPSGARLFSVTALGCEHCDRRERDPAQP